MPAYKHIEDELQRMREAKAAIERQLAELQRCIDRTERVMKEDAPKA
jgi:hypothetical protein